MRRPSLIAALCLAVSLPGVASAQGEDAPPSSETELAPPDRNLPLEQDPMTVEGAGVWPEGFSDPASASGNPCSVVQGGEVQADGPVVLAAAASGTPELTLAGFAHADLHAVVFDNGSYADSFRLRGAELNVLAQPAANTSMVLDFTFGSDLQSTTFQTQGFDRQLLQHLMGQGYLEWTGPVKVVAGKIDAPFGVESLDVRFRPNLSRSQAGILGTPDSLTGLFVSGALSENVDVLVHATNGWDVAIDNNKAKTLGAGAPHRFGRRGDSWFFSGSLDAMVGAERLDTNDVRWLLDYSAIIEPADWVSVALEVFYAQEQGLGFDGKTGLPDDDEAATWYGGQISASVAGDALQMPGSVLALRLEYLHDNDLALGLPALGGLPALTTLFATTLTARHPITPNLEVALEYRVDFERGDVKNVQVQRNVDAFPEVWNLRRWFVTQGATLALIGAF